MAEVFIGGDAVADALLEFFGFGEAAFGFAGPDGFAIDSDLEYAAAPPTSPSSTSTSKNAAGTPPSKVRSR